APRPRPLALGLRPRRARARRARAGRAAPRRGPPPSPAPRARPRPRARAARLGRARGPYLLQAAIAACHARAREASATDWSRIASLYDALAQAAPSPVVELNRAVARSMAFGPAAGLEIVD